ncbi:MAG: YlbF family regulator [Defluviitaleaceae bacterium]|nr:YlbF family regulator [Defluviitaleaceae bacterium]
MVFEKTRELGNLILSSDYKKILDEAYENFNKNKEAKQKFEFYESYKQNLKNKKKFLKKEELQNEIKKIKILEEELEKEEDIICLLNAEEDYNNYVNKVLQILKFTIKGTTMQKSFQSCSNCNRCGAKK